MILTDKPEGFQAKFEIAGSFVEYDDKILVLHRQDHKPEGNTWGLPAGKREGDEDTLVTIAREVNEETGIEIPTYNFKLLGTFYNRYQDYDFMFHLFTVRLQSQKEVNINPAEHKEFLWVDPKEALAMPLIEDLPELLKQFYP